MKHIAGILFLVSLAGCGMSPKLLENRVVCTVDGSEAHVLSKWGPVSIGTQIARADAPVLCGEARATEVANLRQIAN